MPLRHHEPARWRPGRLFAVVGLLCPVAALALAAAEIFLFRAEPDAATTTAALTVLLGSVIAILLLLRKTMLDALEQARRIAEDSEQRFKDFAEAASDWFWETGPDLAVTYLSEPAAKSAETANEIQVGQAALAFLSSNPTEELRQYYRDHLEQHLPFRDFRYPFRREDGRKLHFRVSGIPRFDADGTFLGYRGVASNVTAEVEARQSAEQSAAHLRDAIESLDTVGIALFNTAERLVLCNARYREIYALGGDVFLGGMRIEDLLRLSVLHNGWPDTAGREEEWIADELARFRYGGGEVDRQLGDGHWVRCGDQRIPSGGAISLRPDITDLKRVQQRLVDAIDSSPAGFALYDPNERLVMVNGLATAIFGPFFSTVSAVGRHFDELILGSAASHLPALRADRRAEYLAARRAHFRDAPQTPFRQRFDDGRWLEIHCRKTAEGGRVLAYVDITERTRAELALQESETMFRGFLTASPNAMLVVDATGRIVLASRSADALFGAEGTLAGTALDGLVPERDRRLHRAHFAGFFTHPQVRHMGEGMELRALHRDGMEFPVEISLSPHTTPDGPVVLAVIRDISIRKQTEEHLRRVQKMEALGTLAGGIAHDLNNTLVPILGLSKLAGAGLPEGTLERELLDDIAASANRAKGLVEQILAFSRSDVTAYTPIDLGRTVGEALRLVRPAIPPTVRLHFDAAPNGQERLEILGNDIQIHQIVMNLCVNAAQAIGDERGDIRVGVTEHILDQGEERRLSLKPGRYIRLSVVDTGCGMDDLTRQRIFDPFFTTKEIGKGTGLGLSIVHGIVTAHGGDIAVASQLHDGARFDLYFPKY